MWHFFPVEGEDLAALAERLDGGEIEQVLVSRLLRVVHHVPALLIAHTPGMRTGGQEQGVNRALLGRGKHRFKLVRGQTEKSTGHITLRR